MRFNVMICLVLFLAAPVWAANWSTWRGTNLDGVAQGTGYPTEWSARENVAWNIELPGRGSSTPIVWNNQIFLTCGIDGKNTILAYDLNGKELWRTEVGAEKPGKHVKASGANSSCVTDGEYLFGYFKSGDLVCLNVKGEKVWKENLQEKFGEDNLWWDLGTSPVLTKKYCVVAVMQTGGSYLAAFEKSTGKVAWKVDRNLNAPEEANQSYSTPVVVEEEGQEHLIVLGADHVTSHRADNGQEVWRVSGLNPSQNGYFRSIASPAVNSGLVVAPYARGKSLTAIKLGGHGEVSKSHVAWQKEGSFPDVPSPAVANGRAYILNDKGIVTCLNIQSGEVIWTGQTPKKNRTFSSSPILADGKIYLTREDGTTFVLAQGDEFKILAENELDGDQTVATPVFVDGHILLRTDRSLYCIGRK